MKERCLHPDCGMPSGECQSNCLLFQMRRVNAEMLDQFDCVKVLGHVEEVDLCLPDDSRLTAARWAFKTHRPLGLRVAIRKAWRAFWRKA